MQASPTKLEDGSWGIRIWDPNGNAAGWSGQAVTIEARSGKSWGAKVGMLVKHEGALGIYTDAKNDPADESADVGTSSIEATPERLAQIADNYRHVAEHRAEVREFLEDDILPVRRLIKQGLDALRIEADLSDDDLKHALYVYDKLAGLGHVDDEVPFEFANAVYGRAA
jgi:hypothetical protein